MDLDKIIRCAELSLASYDEAGAVLAGYSQVHLCEEDVQADLLWNDDEIILVFRGTESFRDIVRDLDVFGGGQVHNGFQKGLSSLQWSLSDKLQAIDGLDNRPITITGHSMGGALAVLAAYRLPVVVDTVVTFGAPKVGGKEFRRRYRATGNWDKTMQVVNGADQVPRMQFFRRHVGQRLLLSKNQVIVKPRSWKLLSEFLLSNPTRRITDHLMKNYIGALRNADRH